MNNGFGKYLTTSSIMHVTFAALLFFSLPKGCGGAGVGQGDSHRQKQQTLIESNQSEKKDTTVEVTLVEVPRRKASAKIPNPCRSGLTFGGIGIEMILTQFKGERVGIVSKVIKGYPADVAGFKNGWIIFNPDTVKGEVGTPVMVTVRIPETYALSNLIMTREKICYEYGR